VTPWKRLAEMSAGVVVLISADAEWRALCAVLPAPVAQPTPFGAWFSTTIQGREVIFIHGGWGKIAAASSTQYAIDRWQPRLLVNLGTCGGFAGEIERGEVLLVEHTLVYDIVEQMGDAQQALDFYTTHLDLTWLGDELPMPVRRGLLVSADRDLLVEDIVRLKTAYGAAAADWESGAIAWVAARSGVRCLILRAVTDLVSASAGEAYGDYDLFAQRTAEVMQRLVNALPEWLRLAQ
jgi:adenosylhomocysteine nucleosidase